jgi:hypothetical protein
MEYPTATGCSKYTIVIFLLHEYGLEVHVLAMLSTKNGPFSYANASNDEHPGPPVNQNTTGSVSTLFSLATMR